MIKNYFKTAFRNLWKNKASSFINIFGLTIGLCSCLLIGLYIQHELSYDKFQTNGDRIARVIMAYKFDGGTEMKKGNFTSARVAPRFKQTFPEIESAVRMVRYSRVVQYKDKLINENSFMYADPEFFNLFSFKLLRGEPSNVLKAPNQVVLTESTAKRYFSDEDPIGKVLKVGTDTALYQVTGVIQDCPSNSQIKFDFLSSWSSLGLADEEKSYWDANYTTYLLLKDKESIATLQSKITPFMKKEMAGQGATVDYELEPFNKIHLYSPYEGFEPNNSITYIYILEAVALLMLAIASFTYVNLNTARSMERAREVGVRKVIGAGNRQLFWQFIGESVLLCTISTILSVLAAALLLPVFNQLSDKQLTIAAIFSIPFTAGALLLIILVSFLAGTYPALILSNFQPVRVLKGSFKNTNSGRWVRKSLIVFQFSISVVLIISTFIMQKQLNYIQNRNLGYNREQVLVLPMDNKMQAKVDLIKQEFKSNANVISISRCTNPPTNIVSGYNMRSATMPETQQIAVTANVVDEDFVNTIGLQILTGSNLTQQDIKDASYDDYKKNSFHFILNESAARQLGWTPEQAIGKKMFMDDTRPGYVKAVVKDFNFESMHNPIKPLVLFPEERGRILLLKLKGNNLQQTISFLESKWKQLVPYRPFEYHFLDEDFNSLYSSEMRLGKVLTVFASVAIALACLGLLGLSAYAAKQRVKEIGIRKVLGASVSNITALLSVDFVKLVFIAIIISVPVAWWMMNKWLLSFAYKTDMNWWIFVVAGICAVAIALITISFQSIKSALANPVKSLRSE
ncbi:ABC transporter permease [Mucilaginibacter sp. BT774]|uniref:ABC transporter permease n=1 Tax=Mucilaginibacter sp. BT774 TaxID=3062276 RepID=UPI002674C52D|nr:ABC transporter permease [Mucilaginibacter sp. BT774]MDO3625111.1 ABC transporter permease [Mucilaginibacter sp. BT774]